MPRIIEWAARRTSTVSFTPFAVEVRNLRFASFHQLWISRIRRSRGRNGVKIPLRHRPAVLGYRGAGFLCAQVEVSGDVGVVPRDVCVRLVPGFLGIRYGAAIRDKRSIGGALIDGLVFVLRALRVGDLLRGGEDLVLLNRFGNCRYSRDRRP